MSLFSFSQKLNTKKAVYPFREVLKSIDTVILRANKRSGYKTILLEPQIAVLSNQAFFNKNITVENYGVTPEDSISLFYKGKRIALIGTWTHNQKYYAVNISINEKFRHHGLVILKETFDKLFQ